MDTEKINKEFKETMAELDRKALKVIEDNVVDENDFEEDFLTWDALKEQGSKHYKTGLVEPIDLYKAGNMFHDKACTDIIKYAYRSRKEVELSKELFNSNMDKIIHLANLLKALINET